MVLTNKLTIRGRIIGSFSLLVICTIGLGLFSLYRLEGVSRASSVIAEDLNGVKLLGEMARLSQQIRALDVLSHFARSDQERQGYASEIQQTHEDFSAAWSDYAPTVSSGAEQELAVKLKTA